MKLAPMSLALAVAATPVEAAESPQRDPPMLCDFEPLRQSYGGGAWWLFSCSDHSTLVVVADNGNPASPFYFIFSPKDGAYRLHGEGTGKKEAMSAAFEDLKKLGSSDIAALIAETRRNETRNGL
jgi:hypothetical protein